MSVSITDYLVIGVNLSEQELIDYSKELGNESGSLDEAFEIWEEWAEKAGLGCVFDWEYCKFYLIGAIIAEGEDRRGFTQTRDWFLDELDKIWDQVNRKFVFSPVKQGTAIKLWAATIYN